MQSELRIATPNDSDRLLELTREFTATQVYPFQEIAARRALDQLLASPALGVAWLLEVGGDAAGYVILTLGFSLEYGGRDAFVDELFVRPAFRGRGFGRAALSLALEAASQMGVRAVHLEVERAIDPARRLYRSLGFEGNDRELLTRRLHSG